MANSIINDPNLHLPDFIYPRPFMGRGEISCVERDAAKNYIVKAICNTRENGMYESMGEFGIKFLGHGAMAILYIPKGSLIHIEGYGPTEYRKDVDSFHANAKCRTELALCVEIGKFSISNDTKEDVDENGNMSFSTELVIEKLQIGGSLFETHVGKLTYLPMRLVYPDEPFDMNDNVCASGIHYYHRFVNFGRIFETTYLDMGDILNTWMYHVANSKTIKEFEEIVAEEREKLIISNRNLLGYVNGKIFTEEVNKE